MLRRLALGVGLLVALALAGASPDARAQDAQALREQVAEQRAREGRQSRTARRLGREVAKAERRVAVIERRLAEVQADYAAARARVQRTTAEREAARARLARLRAKLARYRATLADTLRASYTTGRPDVVDVALASEGFADLLDRMAFLERVTRSNTNVVGVVTTTRDAVRAEEVRLGRLLRRQRREATAARRQRDAIAQMRTGLEERRRSLASARAAQLAALRDTRSSRRRAERELGRIEARAAREARRFAASAARAASGSPRPAGGPSYGADGDWSIPWDIVQCESGGQNMTPNSAKASGYYQFIPSTWRGLGGSTPHAYQASKSEQDRLARKLWAGGGGKGNWDCAAMVD